MIREAFGSPGKGQRPESPEYLPPIIIAGTSASFQSGQIDDETAYYDAIPESGSKIPRKWLLNSVSQRMSDIIKREKSPEIEMDEVVVSSPLL